MMGAAGTFWIVTACFDKDGENKRIPTPFGRQDCTVFQQVETNVRSKTE